MITQHEILEAINDYLINNIPNIRSNILSHSVKGGRDMIKIITDSTYIWIISTGDNIEIWISIRIVHTIPISHPDLLQNIIVFIHPYN